MQIEYSGCKTSFPRRSHGRLPLVAVRSTPVISLLWLSLACLAAPADGPDLTDAPAQRVNAPAIENLYRLSERIYSGGQPEGDVAFESLEQLGVRTIISVDGAAPDVETARQHNMRYVHLPIGYDGIPAARALAMVKAVRDLPGPVFIHCHHGKHRGPAAAALCAVAVDNWSRDKATQWMKLAGTSPDYRGLFRSIQSLAVPTEDELKSDRIELPERAAVSTLVENMVAVDHDWDRIKAFREAEFKATNGDEPTPAQVALELAERFRELARSEAAKEHGEKFIVAAREAEQSASRLEKALRALAERRNKPALDEAQARFREAAQVCTSCHKAFRDKADAN